MEFVFLAPNLDNFLKITFTSVRKQFNFNLSFSILPLDSSYVNQRIPISSTVISNVFKIYLGKLIMELRIEKTILFFYYNSLSSS